MQNKGWTATEAVGGTPGATVAFHFASRRRCIIMGVRPAHLETWPPRGPLRVRGRRAAGRCARNDLTPNPQYGREERDLALVCGRYGTRASRQNLLSAAPRFGLTHDDAAAVVDRIVDVIQAYWRPDVFAQGGTADDCARIEAAFVHAGFDYEATE